MCGILLGGLHHDKDKVFFRRRGPDRQGQHEVDGITLEASVLCMRDVLVAQPCAIGDEAWLAWNGEVYTAAHEDVSGRQHADTLLVANRMRLALEQSSLAAVQWEDAEFAWVILTRQHVYFSRDMFGRRSLLMNLHRGQLQLASVATSSDGWEEVPPGRVYCFDRRLRTLSYETIPKSADVISLPPFDSMESASLHLEQVLREAVRKRIAGATSVGLLFSGGIDSVVLAALVLQLLQPFQELTLVNVSFIDGATASSPPAADTLAAEASWDNLRELFPDANVRFMPEQVTWDEMIRVEDHIRRLIYPKTSTMDLNIGMALWFAARAAPGRVLLTGLGADEQLGGYGRHKKAWDKSAYAGLRKELDLDLARLWERNLGRDDRVLSDSSKEARFPFLDHNVVQFLRAIPLDQIVDYRVPLGDKRILRLLAARMGLSSASTAVKRAIQFGSRIAHVSDKRRFGSRRKANGTSQSPSTS